MRLDSHIYKKFNLRSRTYAENLILKGMVNVDGVCVIKPAYEVSESNLIEIINDEDFASQGAYKLQKALNFFKIDVTGKACIDLGCSNGGFTDLLLRCGAASVLAVDVGENALPSGINQNPKVRFLRKNVRELTPDDGGFEFATVDLSFISLKKVLKNVYDILLRGGEAILLVKPQFEVGKRSLSKSGIVGSEKERLAALNEIKSLAQTLGLTCLGSTEIPLLYKDKNIEYLIHLRKPRP